MKNIKAINLVFVVALIAVLCGSCKKHGFADDLVQYLNERDEEGIMNLLREKARTSNDIDLEQQISDVFDLFGDRTITSFDWQSSGEETHWEKGKKTRCRGGTIIDEVELSDGSDDIDIIAFYTVWIDEEDPGLVGMNWIKIITDDEEEYRIGEPNVQ